MTKFFSKLIICFYCRKYSSCFEPDEMSNFSTESNCDTVFDRIREKTWHKTIVSNNQLPTTSTIVLHFQRISAILALNSIAMFSDLNISEYLKLGWKMIDTDRTLLLSSFWDTDESWNKLGLLRKTFLQMCGCANSSCRTKRCRRKSSGSFCLNICSGTIVKIGRWAMAMIKRKKKMTKFSLHQKIKMMMGNLSIKKRMIPLQMTYWD